MAKVVPDIAYLREPNLLIPGKKPIGPVKVDWEHPIASNGIGFIYGPTIINKLSLTLTGATESHAGLSFAAVADRAISTVEPLTFNKPSAFIVVFRPNSYGSGSSFGRLFSNTSTAYAPEAYLRETSTGLTWRTSGTTTTTYNWDTGGFDWGNRYCFVLANNGVSNNTTACLYDLTNHKLKRSITTGITGSITARNPSIIIGNGEGYNRGFDGVIEMVTQVSSLYPWSNPLEVARDPYQFLIPA